LGGNAVSASRSDTVLVRIRNHSNATGGGQREVPPTRWPLATPRAVLSRCRAVKARRWCWLYSGASENRTSLAPNTRASLGLMEGRRRVVLA